MMTKRYALLCLSLMAAVTLPIVNRSVPSPIPAVMAQTQQALDYLNQALLNFKKIGIRYREAIVLVALGKVYGNSKQFQKELDYYKQALPFFEEVKDRFNQADTLGSIGIAYQNNNQPSEAIKNLEASLNITLEIRGTLSRENRKSFLSANENSVVNLAEILIQQNQPEEAFKWLNLATTADLADYNRLIDAKVANPEAQKALDNWNANSQQLEGMRQQLQNQFSEGLAKQIREFEAKVYQEAENIGQKYPEVAELFETKPTDIVQLRNNIPQGTLVIQPIVLREKVAIFILTKEKLVVIESKTKADDFNQLVSQYSNQLADYQNADVYVTSSKLAVTLDMGGTTRLCPTIYSVPP